MTKDELEQRKAHVGELLLSRTKHRMFEQDYIDTIEQTWAEREDAIKARDFLTGQNTELLEDIAAVRKERDALKAKVEELEAVRVGSTLCPLEDVEALLIEVSNRLYYGRAKGDRLETLVGLEVGTGVGARMKPLDDVARRMFPTVAIFRVWAKNRRKRKFIRRLWHIADDLIYMGQDNEEQVHIDAAKDALYRAIHMAEKGRSDE